jgi:glycosyltransferase involved in cell wall biosynthesis
MSQLLVAGINLHKKPEGGEHYKNHLIHDFFVTSSNITTLDTHYWRSNPWILFKLFYLLLVKNNWDKIIVSVTPQSALRIIQILCTLSPINAKKIVYFVIGGNLPKMLDSSMVVKMNKINRMIVEGQKIKKELIDIGINTKIDVLPNFKRVERIEIDKKELKFLYIGTITKSKGVFDILYAIENLEISFHFYGPMDLNEEDQITFKSKLTEKIEYKGYLNILNNEKAAYTVLSKYTALVFPTYYPGEGFPGVFIDAFIAGLPIITTNWNMNEEIVINGFNGRIINVQDIQGLRDAILWYQNNFLQDEYLIHVKNAVRSAQNYSYPKVLSDYYHAHWNS